MDEKEKYEYGQPIPSKYRNRLFEWAGGGYDGCFWEMNQGLVDKNGHWHPIYSTGCDGIDQDEWYDRKIKALKAELGYDCSDVETQHWNELHHAVEVVFGKPWYEVTVEGCDSDPRVKKLMEDNDARYNEFVKQRDAYRLEQTHRLDSMFMEALKRSSEPERPNEIGMIDDEHVKDTCREFCERYSGNVGMMTNCLDKMANMGYDVWCTCSDCGEQFQCGDFEAFGCSIDNGAYTGDGGIGVIMKRVLCDECRQNAECRNCFELGNPNHNKKDGGASDWANYDFLACVLHEWIDVCWGCASGFECDHLYYWDKAANQRFRTKLGLEYENIEEDLKREYGLDGHELYEEIVKTPGGRKKINKIRDLLHDAVVEHFSPNMYECECWFDDRLDTDHPGQMKLPGI